MGTEDRRNTKTNGLTQSNQPDDKEFLEIIKREAKDRNIRYAAYVRMSEIIDKAKEYYSSRQEYLKSWFYTSWFKSYKEMCVTWALDSMQQELEKIDKRSIEFQIYLGLEENDVPEYNFENLNDSYDKTFKEVDRITAIMDMLSTEKIFGYNMMSINKTPYTLHEAMSKLQGNKPERLKECILQLKEFCDSEGVKSVLQSANKNDAAVLVDFEEDRTEVLDRFTDYFIKRLELMTSYIGRVSEKIDSDGKTFGSKYWIRSTGSDPHNEGQHALFFVNKQDQKGCENDDRKKAGRISKVYKPHDLAADNAVVGKNGVLSNINKFFKEHNTLKDTMIKDEDTFATMDIDVKHHTEEFIIKKSTMTQEEAQKYFFRAGILKVITDAMAVVDLHQDNIMPTEKGPMIIDAEINFFQYINSGLEEAALSKDEHAERLSNSSFIIEEEMERSGQLFKDKTSKYYQKYKNGYDFMLYQTYKNKDEFAAIYESKLKNIDKVRIIPLATSELAGTLQGVIEKGISQKSVDELSEEIEKNLCERSEEVLNYGFIFRKENSMKVHIFKDKLQKAVETTFNNGTIIALYVNMEGKILLDNDTIGEFVEFNKFYKLGREDVIYAMKQDFLMKINQLHNKNALKLFDESDLFQTDVDV